MFVGYCVLISLPLAVSRFEISHSALDVQVPEDPVVARFGSDVTLNCSFSSGSAFNLSDLSIFWHLTDTKRPVHSFSSGQDQDQGGSYSNRTQLYPGELRSGNASLLLRRVQIQDEGSFTCFVRIREYNSAALLLQVAGRGRVSSEILYSALVQAVVKFSLSCLSRWCNVNRSTPWRNNASYSKPQLTLEPDSNLRPGDEVSVSCLAYGGYPQASVLWQDGKGANLTENVTTSQVASDEGLFNVWSVLRVMLEPNSTYSCIVRNPVLGEETHASVTITEDNKNWRANTVPSHSPPTPPLSPHTAPPTRTPFEKARVAVRILGFWETRSQHMSFPPLALWVTVGLAVCLLGLLVALAYICRHKIRESCKEGATVEQGQETEDEESKTVGLNWLLSTQAELGPSSLSVSIERDTKDFWTASVMWSSKPRDHRCSFSTGKLQVLDSGSWTIILNICMAGTE
ncbi:CD276 protein, partial [Polyodon spathula]|nr:CD276 protein [Polyodon spathula]